MVERSEEHTGNVHRGGGPNDCEGNDRLYIKNTANGKKTKAKLGSKLESGN